MGHPQMSGLGGLAGGLLGGLGQLDQSQLNQQMYNRQLGFARQPFEIAKKPLSWHEELQVEITEWLPDL